MWAAIRAIEYCLADTVVTNDELAALSNQWTAEEIAAKTGIVERRVAKPDQCATDLAVAAADSLFQSGACAPNDVDYLLFCTQSPDYFLPSSACLVQQRLGMRKSIGALDFTLGCSGFVYGLSLAKGLIETGQAQNVLLLTADTYSKYLRPDDLSVRTLFGDAAAATLVQAADGPTDEPRIGPFCFGTDGRGAEHLIVRDGAMRAASRKNHAISDSPNGVPPSCLCPLQMNGPEIFAFTLNVVPRLVSSVLQRASVPREDVRWFILHQANKYMLDHLRKKMEIPENRFCISMSHSGNTVSSTIPIALKETTRTGALKAGDRVMLIGFGVGYSWAGTLLRWAQQHPSS